MAQSLNKIMLLGRVGQDPEVRQTGSGKTVASFSLATSEQWKGADGEKHEETTWHKIVAWNRTAEIVGEYVRKGGQIFIEGKLTIQEWEDRDGNKRTTPEVVASQVILLGGRGDGQSSGRRQEERKPSKPAQPTGGYSTPPPENEIPF
ncbi:MAG: single-stranded DNA-binding protein [Patescibacteria group bacterium]